MSERSSHRVEQKTKNCANRNNADSSTVVVVVVMSENEQNKQTHSANNRQNSFGGKLRIWFDQNVNHLLHLFDSIWEDLCHK